MTTAAAVVATLLLAPAATAEPPPGVADVDAYPVAQGRYSVPSDYGWLFFTTPDGRACGIGPNGGPVGCDAVPADAPPGTAQTVVAPGSPAVYRPSAGAGFGRDGVDVLPEGHRLVNFGASCAMGFQGAVTCQTYGRHGFTISGGYGVLW
ncbi:hypothetical protein MCHIJ_40820 [Mycolicibacterium chitae]|nr:hypothetical protein [Mycolicibacterium chitae]MCV7105801.1 hypothetical protein [Mycolicibacterium chitae]BBZ04645.1 hypothetical protein MCHIJ_40820 [Mycolicibacterium chitae]